MFRKARLHNVSSSKVSDPTDGHVAESDAQAAGIMRTTWAPTCVPHPIDKTILARFLGSWDIDLSALEFKMPEEEFIDMVKHPKDSSAGRDGVHYRLWSIDEAQSYYTRRIEPYMMVFLFLMGSTSTSLCYWTSLEGNMPGTASRYPATSTARSLSATRMPNLYRAPLPTLLFKLQTRLLVPSNRVL